MKKFILTLSILSFVGFATVSCNDDDDNHHTELVDFNSLPENSQVFVRTYFPSAAYTVDRIERYNPAESNGAVYEVRFTNGTEIDFNVGGDWIDVEGGGNEAIPDGFILEPIKEYVSQYYPAKIHQIKKHTNGNFEVELTNDNEYLFNSAGNLLPR